jgi:hypothetical protein
MEVVGLFYGHLVYVMVVWYIFPVLVYCTKKNLATPVVSERPFCNMQTALARTLSRVKWERTSKLYSFRMRTFVQ